MDLMILVKAAVALVLGGAIVWIAVNKFIGELLTKLLVLVSLAWSVIVVLVLAIVFLIWMFDFTEVLDTIMKGVMLTSIPAFISYSILTGMAVSFWVNVWKDSRSKR